MNALDTIFSSYRAKDPEVAAAWDCCEARIRALPSPLAALGAGFLASVSEGSLGHRGYFSIPLAPPLLYLPLWLRDRLVAEGAPGVDDARATTAILTAAMLGYFYVRIQDDALDEPHRGHRDLALFGNVCLSGMYAAFGDALGARAPWFLCALDRAFAAFSRHTHDELRAVRGGGAYPSELFEAHAEKVAFARVPMLAVAALADRPTLEAPVAALVHRLGVGYGLTNDALGWPRDLRAGHRTHLLAHAGLERADLDAAEAITDPAARAAAYDALTERVRAALYEGGLLRRWIERAASAQREAAELARAMGLDGFEGFSADRTAWLEALGRRADAMVVRRVLLRASRA